MLGMRSTLCLSNGTQFQITQALDLLILVETALLDVYGCSALENPSLVVDIGAGFGDFSILIAKRFPACRVYAFEPDPRQFALLKENVSLNGVTNVVMHDVAIGAKESLILFQGPHKGTTSPIKSESNIGEISVACRPLSDFID
ncbi:MAG: hypothetical protein DCC75_12685, partial [Proteobacteria bacterium]